MSEKTFKDYLQEINEDSLDMKQGSDKINFYIKNEDGKDIGSFSANMKKNDSVVFNQKSMDFLKGELEKSRAGVKDYSAIAGKTVAVKNGKNQIEFNIDKAGKITINT